MIYVALLIIECNNLILHIPDELRDYPFHHSNVSFRRRDLFSSFEQFFSANEPVKDVLHDEKHWELSVPQEMSGPCHTYNPLHESEPGPTVGTYIKMKDDFWDPALQIFLHKEDKFFYSHYLKWDYFLDAKALEETKLNHPRLKGTTLL